MTKAEAIEELQSMCDHLHAHGICDKDSNMLTACKMAISALEQPCEAVSREDALKSLIDNTDFEGWELSQALEAIEKLPSVTRQTKWIPVSERLPEEETYVLICNGNGDIELSRGSYSTEVENYFIWYTSGWRFGEVIAWMPLPEPYDPQERSEKE